MAYIKNPYDLFNKTIIGHINLYLDKNEDSAAMPPIAYRLRSQTFYHRALNPFTEEEAKELDRVTDLPGIVAAKKNQVSFIIFALELARLLVEEVPADKRPRLNINDKKLLVGHRAYLTQMLGLKAENPELYKEKKEIIESTREIVRNFFDCLKENLVKE